MNNNCRRNNFRPRQNKMIYNLVPLKRAREMIENNEVVLIDVRSENEYEMMHIKNAISMPVNKIEESINSIKKEQNIMIYCSTGSRSKQAINKFNSMGYYNIYIWEYAALANFIYKDLIEYPKNMQEECMIYKIKDENFDDTILKEDGLKLVEFYATWCGPCMRLSPILEEISNSRSSYKIYKLNVDESKKIAKRYFIDTIPAMLIYKDGKLLDKYIGFKTKKEIIEILNKYE